MAYGLVIAAVRLEKFSDFMDQLRRKKENDPLPFLEYEKVVETSHYFLSAGTGNAAFDDAMANLLESGQEISEAYWHPYRSPLSLDASILPPLVDAFKKAYQDMLSQLPTKSVNAWDLDILPIIHLADFAVQNNLSWLTFMDRPFDEERASKVHFPIDIQTEADFWRLGD
jgi:hypothetical protein